MGRPRGMCSCTRLRPGPLPPLALTLWSDSRHASSAVSEPGLHSAAAAASATPRGNPSPPPRLPTSPGGRSARSPSGCCPCRCPCPSRCASSAATSRKARWRPSASHSATGEGVWGARQGPPASAIGATPSIEGVKASPSSTPPQPLPSPSPAPPQLLPRPSPAPPQPLPSPSPAPPRPALDSAAARTSAATLASGSSSAAT
jgi:hypothetical protein